MRRSPRWDWCRGAVFFVLLVQGLANRKNLLELGLELLLRGAYYRRARVPLRLFLAAAAGSSIVCHHRYEAGRMRATGTRHAADDADQHRRFRHSAIIQLRCVEKAPSGGVCAVSSAVIPNQPSGDLVKRAGTRTPFAGISCPQAPTNGAYPRIKIGEDEHLLAPIRSRGRLHLTRIALDASLPGARIRAGSLPWQSRSGNARRDVHGHSVAHTLHHSRQLTRLTRLPAEAS